MTPKEKAVELVENFKPKCDGFLGGKINKAFAKQCAQIPVHEILYFMDMFNLDLEMTHQHKWWQQVKTEIENL